MAIQRPLKPVPTLKAANDLSTLLLPEEGPAVDLVNPEGKADLLMICEHASNRLPKALGNLGLDGEALQSHIAFDPGAEPVARLMSEALDAPLVLQRFSRLAYDCNRPPDAPSAMPSRSEIFDIPGNADLSAAERALRTDSLYSPFHQAISDHLDRTLAAGRRPAIVTIHSFTPVFHGQPRAVELGLLHDRDALLVDQMLDLMSERGVSISVERNQPYGPEDGVTHSLQKHALPRGLPNAMIEIRNDLIADPEGQASIGSELVWLVRQALDRLQRSTGAEKRHAAG